MGVIDRRRIERLTAALAHAGDAAEAAGAIGEIIDRTGKPGYKPAPDAESSRLWASVKPGHNEQNKTPSEAHPNAAPPDLHGHA